MALVCEYMALVCEDMALVCEYMALVCEYMALVCAPSLAQWAAAVPALSTSHINHQVNTWL
jgi:hypothetical protein